MIKCAPSALTEIKPAIIDIISNAHHSKTPKSAPGTAMSRYSDKF